MRVLLDECLPRRLRSVLPGHEVRTVPEAGWAGKQNGELLALAADAFDAFVTLDQNLQYKQNLEHAALAIAVLRAKSSRFEDLQPLIPGLLEFLEGTPEPGVVVRIEV